MRAAQRCRRVCASVVTTRFCPDRLEKVARNSTHLRPLAHLILLPQFALIIVLLLAQIRELFGAGFVEAIDDRVLSLWYMYFLNLFATRGVR